MPLSDDTIAVLRIEVEGIEPLIWRRVTVRTAMNLQALHKVIQVTMGWLDYHLWEFIIEGRRYAIADPDDGARGRPIENGVTTRLNDILIRGVTELGYVYDFGDHWKHRIIVETVKPAQSGSLHLQFLGGERRCPPEDCGGVPGYYDFLSNIASRQDSKRKAALRWYGGPYDPNDIDAQRMVIALKYIANTWRPVRPKTIKT